MTVLRRLIREICGLRSDSIDDALSTAQLAHLGQTRKTGEAYIEHPKEVARIVYSLYGDPVLCAAALLHDTLEDAVAQGNFETIEELETMINASFGDPNMGDEILRIVRKMTHHKDASYDAYVLSLLGDPAVLKIKLSDMLHNLRSNPSVGQINKYAGALQALQDASGGVPPGINQVHWNALQNAASDDTLREGKLRAWIRKILKEERH